jgi:hypothetical protein
MQQLLLMGAAPTAETACRLRTLAKAWLRPASGLHRYIDYRTDDTGRPPDWGVMRQMGVNL